MYNAAFMRFITRHGNKEKTSDFVSKGSMENRFGEMFYHPNQIKFIIRTN
jgi:hypothetical protein